MRAVHSLLPLLLISCGEKTPPEPAAVPEPAPVADAELTALVTSAMDMTADPCVDFYQYACGGWLATTEIPGDEAIWARSFSEIDKRNEELVKQLLESSVGAAEGKAAQVGALYGSCMDEAAIEAAGAAPLKPWLDEIDALKGDKALMSLVGRMHAVSADVFFTEGVYPDFTDPNLEILHMSQGGLGLPDREYYLRTGEEDVALRAAYVAHIAKMLELAGINAKQAKTDAEAVLAFETELAKVQWARVDLRDPVKTYNKLDRKGLQAMAPKFPWDAFFEGLGGAGIQHINVEVPDYYQALPKLIGDAKPATRKAYLRWHLVHSLSNHLSDAFVQESFAFYGQKIVGQKEIKPRWKRCVDFTTSAAGDLVGELYVAEAFPGESKETALELIHGIEEAFGQNLTSLSWMDDATRDKALEKRSTLVNKIGYPDKWRDYSGLQVGGAHFANVLASRGHQVAFYIGKVGNPKDAGEWYMPPHVVNAYYNPLNNEMVFPAGILQPPFFSKDYPDSMNYGAIGVVMGHELTHGYDDTGRQFDAKGQMVEWWAPEAVERFNAQAQCVVDQYNGYEVLPGVNLNGELTLGENIADLGGLKEAWQAWKTQATKNPPTRHVEGLSQEQLFFVAFGQAWCSKATPEIEQLRATVDTHSSPRFRVLGSVSNLPAFGEAFQCEVGSPMRPEKVCEVW